MFFSDSSETETTKKQLKKGTKKVLRRQDFFREFEAFKKDKRKYLVHLFSYALSITCPLRKCLNSR